jgi:hypothetical protein
MLRDVGENLAHLSTVEALALLRDDSGMGCAVTLECGDADEVWCIPLHQDRTIRSNNHDTR